MKKETFRFLFFAAVYTLALFGFAVTLTGCSTVAKCIVRDNTSNPCN